MSISLTVEEYIPALQAYLRSEEPMYSLERFISNKEYFTDNLLEPKGATYLKSAWGYRWKQILEKEEINNDDVEARQPNWKLLETRCYQYFKNGQKRKRKAPFDLSLISQHNTYIHGDAGNCTFAGVNISNLFETERQNAMRLLDEGVEKLSDFQFLALHHILQLPLDPQSHFALKLGSIAAAALNSLATAKEAEDQFHFVSDKCWLAARRLQIALRKSTKQEQKKLLLQLQTEAVDSGDDDMEPLLKIYSKLFEKFQVWIDEPPSEEAFIKQSVQCFVEVVFCGDPRLKHDWATGTLVPEADVLQVSSHSGSSSANVKADMLRPDFLSSFAMDGKAKYDLLVIEVKKPGHHNHQTVPDKDKIPVEMKQALNIMVGDQIPSPRVAGVVIDGYDVRTSYAELNFEAFYQENVVGRCTILKNKSNIENVPSTYEHFKHLKRIMDGVIQNITNNFVAKSSFSSSLSTTEATTTRNEAALTITDKIVPVTYRRPSYPIPGKSSSSDTTTTKMKVGSPPPK